MGMPLIQPTFSGGELSPSLHARVDIERYGNSLKTAKNFIVRPYGGVVNRPGFQYLGEVKDSTKATRLLPFQFSTDVAYIIEFGAGYARFWSNGGLVVDGMGDPVEVVTPYAESELFDVKFTQSADVLYLVHPNHPPATISRTSPTTFVYALFVTREGPFRSINANEALQVAASNTRGTVTVTANADIFTADMVGQLLYMEQKSLGQIRPWVQGDRSVAVGVLRRSDGKTYRAVTVPASTNWTETGSFRPVHQYGREWDGAGDERTDGTNTWRVGVEWEYVDSGYGIVRLTGFTSATIMTGEVVRNLPRDVIGGFGTPANTWTFSGDGTTTVFNVTGATSPSNLNYSVTIDGVPVQSDPNFVPPPPAGGGRIGGPGGGNDPDFPLIPP